VAQRFGSWAEFRMSPIMLFLMLVLVYQFGILFAAPGAVMIYGGNVGRRENGRISLAGPLSNLLLEWLFSSCYLNRGYSMRLGRYGVIVNIALALFNMIPFAIFDGRKVWEWNKPVYLLVVIAALLYSICMLHRSLMAPISRMPF